MNPYLEDADLTLYQGDALEVLRTLPDESVQMCVTSPPFYGLRDYGTGSWEGGNPDCDHRSPTMREGRNEERAKLAGSDSTNAAQLRLAHRSPCGKCGAVKVDQQIGLEETPEQWVDKLVAVFREVRRVLRADGTLWVEVGDSYAANVRSGLGIQDNEGYAPNSWSGKRATQTGKHPYKQKDLVGAPWMLAFALRADGWFLRSDIVWSRPNPMPESVTDRPTKSHSYVFLLSKSPRYFFDQEAIREPHTAAHLQRQDAPLKKNANGESKALGKQGLHDFLHPAGRNSRSVWQIATQPYPEAHFATYPEELVRRCILAGSSERGCCPECGAPWTREVEQSVEHVQATNNGNELDPHGRGTTRHQFAGQYRASTQTLGWRPSCRCSQSGSIRRFLGSPVPCTVLDPFFGSGTTGLVARKHGRRTIGIELSSSYCELAATRLQQLSLLAEGTR